MTLLLLHSGRLLGPPELCCGKPGDRLITCHWWPGLAPRDARAGKRAIPVPCSLQHVRLCLFFTHNAGWMAAFEAAPLSGASPQEGSLLLHVTLTLRALARYGVCPVHPDRNWQSQRTCAGGGSSARSTVGTMRSASAAARSWGLLPMGMQLQVREHTGCGQQ